MKTRLKYWFTIAAAALAAAGLAVPNRTCAQTLNVLRTFTNSPDGNDPTGAFVVSNNVLYSVSTKGGKYGAGMVFRINLDGTDFTNLHSFPAPGFDFTNIGGAYPSTSLVLSSNMLYGATLFGGPSGNGTIYAVDTGGTVFSNLYNFSAFVEDTNGDGAQPEVSLLLISNKLYGAAGGGVFADGTIFSINIDGTDFTNLHNFSPSEEYSYGFAPQTSLVLLSNTLFGTTTGSSFNSGGVFAINTDGTGFTNLYEFGPFVGDANPSGNLVLSGNTLYATAQEGGNAGDGMIFKINTDGSGFAVLHNFGGSDGKDPLGGVFLLNNVLYGTTQEGGSANSGVVYKLNLNNTNFVMLHSFTATSGSHETNSDGATPVAYPIIVSNLLYATASVGGLAGYGTLFTLTLPTSPPLGINPFGSNVVLTWPTNAVGFLLQSATNLAAPAWGNVSPSPVVVNAQNAVTNTVSGSQMFYRLSQ